jgi:hypothetical protein
MKLKPIHKIELESMASKAELTVAEIQASNFYEDIQNVKHLDASIASITPEAIILLARIAATSTSLVSMNLSKNNLNEHVISVAKEAAKSETLTNVNLTWNKPGFYIQEEVDRIADAVFEIVCEHNIQAENKWQQQRDEAEELHAAVECLSEVFGVNTIGLGSVGDLIELVGSSEIEGIQYLSINIDK